ncbi:hypothetical protein MP213Fo_27960 [Pseudochrobactrum sp. MP213Fo]
MSGTTDIINYPLLDSFTITLVKPEVTMPYSQSLS